MIQINWIKFRIKLLFKLEIFRKIKTIRLTKISIKKLVKILKDQFLNKVLINSKQKLKSLVVNQLQ